MELEFWDLVTGKRDRDAGFAILQAARADSVLESIVYTAIGDKQQAFRAISEGAFGFVPKYDENREANDISKTVDLAVAFHERCLDLIDEIEKLAAENPSISAIGDLRTHFIEYIRQVRGRSR